MDRVPATFVTVLTFRARPGEEDAVVALHEARDRNRHSHVQGYLSGELLSDIHDPRRFIDIAHFESEAAARAAMEDPEQATWYRRLVSLAESEPTRIHCRSAWQTG